MKCQRDQQRGRETGSEAIIRQGPVDLLSKQTAAETPVKEMEATSEYFNNSLTNGRGGIQIQPVRKQSE